MLPFPATPLAPTDWGASPFQTLGAAAAAAAKASKAKSAAVALVGSSLSGARTGWWENGVEGLVAGGNMEVALLLVACPSVWDGRQPAHPSNRTVPPCCLCPATDADAAGAAGRVANGLLNGAYEPTRFKSKPNTSTLESGEWVDGVWG